MPSFSRVDISLPPIAWLPTRFARYPMHLFAKRTRRFAPQGRGSDQVITSPFLDGGRMSHILKASSPLSCCRENPSVRIDSGNVQRMLKLKMKTKRRSLQCSQQWIHSDDRCCVDRDAAGEPSSPSRRSRNHDHPREAQPAVLSLAAALRL